jgi:hypothetical protein
MMKRFLAAVVFAGCAASAWGATFTGTGTDQDGNTITFTLIEQIAPATLYVAATRITASCRARRVRQLGRSIRW